LLLPAPQEHHDQRGYTRTNSASLQGWSYTKAPKDWTTNWTTDCKVNTFGGQNQEYENIGGVVRVAMRVMDAEPRPIASQ